MREMVVGGKILHRSPSMHLVDLHWAYPTGLCKAARRGAEGSAPGILITLLAPIAYLCDRPHKSPVTDRRPGTAGSFPGTVRIKLIRRRRKPGACGADRHANGLVGTPVRMAHQVIANEHHRFDSFEETLREDLEHVLWGRLLTSHSLISSTSRSFNSGGDWLLRIAPRMFSRRAVRCASLSF